MLEQKIEALLFLAGRPLSVKKLCELTEAKKTDVEKAADALVTQYESRSSGLLLQKASDSYQMVTHPDVRSLAQAYAKEEVSSELTKPSLETLTIAAYRGPVTKAELEQIRGVNCSLILRNLLIRGLVEAAYDKTKATTVYQVTHDFVRFLGLAKVDELPDYLKLHDHETLLKLLNPDANPQEENLPAV
ncbi:MAG: SMC-Scp complex subunit ScpB [Patescibacteria group bacterium]